MQTLALNLSRFLVKVFLIGSVAGFGLACIWYVLNVPAELGRFGTPVVSGIIFFSKLKKWSAC